MEEHVDAYLSYLKNMAYEIGYIDGYYDGYNASPFDPHNTYISYIQGYQEGFSEREMDC